MTTAMVVATGLDGGNPWMMRGRMISAAMFLIGAMLSACGGEKVVLPVLSSGDGGARGAAGRDGYADSGSPGDGAGAGDAGTGGGFVSGGSDGADAVGTGGAQGSGGAGTGGASSGNGGAVGRGGAQGSAGAGAGGASSGNGGAVGTGGAQGSGGAGAGGATGAGGSGSGGAAAMVIITSPEDLSMGADPRGIITATFSRDIAASTLNATTFLVTLDGTSVAGTVSYEATTRVATFQPKIGLALLGAYRATVTTAVTDAAGTPLASGYSWSFSVRDGQWGAAQRLDPDGTGALYPQVAVDPAGNATAVWQASGIWTTRFVPGVGWGTASGITSTGSFEQASNLAVAASGEVTAVWRQLAGDPGAWTTRFVPGAGWGTPSLLGSGSASAPGYFVQVAVDPAGNVTAVWDQSDGTRMNIWARRYVPGAGWGVASLVETNDAGDAWDPHVAVDPAGNVTTAWVQSDGTRANIWANRFVPGAGWGTASLIETTDAGDALEPRVVVDATGNATAVWYQSDGTRTSIWANRLVPGAGWGIASLIETGDGFAFYPQVVVDAAGTATAIWQQLDLDVTQTNIWANRYVPGAGWGAATLVETDHTHSATRPAIAVGRSGRITAVWAQFDGTLWNLWTNHLVPGAGAVWATASLIDTHHAGDVESPQLAVDPSGDAVVLWQQADGPARSGSQFHIWTVAFR